MLIIPQVNMLIITHLNMLLIPQVNMSSCFTRKQLFYTTNTDHPFCSQSRSRTEFTPWKFDQIDPDDIPRLFCFMKMQEIPIQDTKYTHNPHSGHQINVQNIKIDAFWTSYMIFDIRDLFPGANPPSRTHFWHPFDPKRYQKHDLGGFGAPDPPWRSPGYQSVPQTGCSYIYIYIDYQ